MAADALSVLVIDDNAADADVVERYLTRDPDRSYALSHAETAGDGLDRVEAEAPDCVVLDYNLPDDDGLSVLAALGERTDVRPLPVVFTTGQGTENVAADAIRRGAADYLVKGLITPVRLRLAVRWAVERHRSAREALALQRQFVARVEAGRAEVQDRWFALAEHLSDGVLVLGRGGRVHFANPAARALLGADPEGTDYLDAVAADDRARVEAAWASGGPSETEHALADGRRVRHVAIPGDGSGAVQVVLRAAGA